MKKITISEKQMKEYVAIALVNRGYGKVKPSHIKVNASTVTEHTGEKRVTALSLEVEI